MPLPISLNDIIASVAGADSDGDALQHLADSVQVGEKLTRMADGIVGHFVEQARSDGASWAEIGGSMGVTRQAAQKRFVPRQPTDSTSTAATIFARLNDAGRQATEAAQEHARRAQDDRVSTEHVVLGLLDELEGLATQAVQALDVPLDQVVDAVKTAFAPAGQDVKQGVKQDVKEEAVGEDEPSGDTAPSGQDVPFGKDVPFGQDAKTLFDRALREARRRGKTSVGPEHLLVGLLRDRNSTGAALLNSFGISQKQAERWFNSHSEEEWA